MKILLLVGLGIVLGAAGLWALILLSWKDMER